MNREDKILIIDDDARNVFALNAVLKSRNFTCISAHNAGMGLQVMRADKNIGLVLMDMMMPEMDGYEAIAQIKADKGLKNIPVISVTAQAMTGDREKCFQAGADGYVSKPVDVNELLRLIDKLI